MALSDTLFGLETKRWIELLSCRSLGEVIFSWTLEDIANERLFTKDIVRIPDTFKELDRYFAYFIFPLYEETRAELWSSMESIFSAPIAEVDYLEKFKQGGRNLYNVRVDSWSNRCNGKLPYKTLPGDIFVLTDCKPENISDLRRSGVTWSFAAVSSGGNAGQDSEISTRFKIKTATEVEEDEKGKHKFRYIIFLMNILTSGRILKAMRIKKKDNVMEHLLDHNPERPFSCRCEEQLTEVPLRFYDHITSQLNESQSKAVLSCIGKMACTHSQNPTLDLIWGPPGTGKTQTTSMMLFHLLKCHRKTLVCAPTNVPIRELALRVYTMVERTCGPDSDYTLGDILLFGNEERLKVGKDIEDIYLDSRMKQLALCAADLTGWKHRFTGMSDFLEHALEHYQNREEQKDGRKPSFADFARARFGSLVSSVTECISILRTHIPKRLFGGEVFADLVNLDASLDEFGTMLSRSGWFTSDDLEGIFSSDSRPTVLPELHRGRADCIALLHSLRRSLNSIPIPTSKSALQEFCIRNALLIFSTASSSFKLYSIDLKADPIMVLVIDEAAQLKECETAIPLQINCIKHTILVGDERQLPAMVMSKVSDRAGFGRSLFERFSILRHKKHLLNTQFRMHPLISRFPNVRFYASRIVDGDKVKEAAYEKQYLRDGGGMFGPYSFINIYGTKEESGKSGHSKMNAVEVNVASMLVQKLHRSWVGSGERLSVGVVSPYAAQVAAMQSRFGRTYPEGGDFSVKVRSVDGFQGGEEDVIIISTVRCNTGGSVGFIADTRRTNVSLTRARHCLWILGNETTLVNSCTVWKDLVLDARHRGRFFDATRDEDLSRAMVEVRAEFDRLDGRIFGTSAPIHSSRWKVVFSDDFRASFERLVSSREKSSVIDLLLRLSGGWRPTPGTDPVREHFRVLKQVRVEGIHVAFSVDIIKEIGYTQVLKIWNVLPLVHLRTLIAHLRPVFGRYTDQFIGMCTDEILDRDLLRMPKVWPPSFAVTRLKWDPRVSDFAGSSCAQSGS